MTDPERISRRVAGLSGELLRAGLEEQPSAVSRDRTLAALGFSGALVASSAAAQAAASGVQLSGAATGGGAVVVKATSTALLVKWIGIGVVSVVGLAGAASVATSPAAPAASVAVSMRRAPPLPTSESALLAEPLVAPPAAVEVAPEAAVEAATLPRSSGRASEPSAPSLVDDTVGAPLAAEVASIDEARGALGAGHTERALALLARYEREFPQARLLPEALFLRLEASERSGRQGDARMAAEQLLRGFPKSPHAARARKVLER